MVRGEEPTAVFKDEDEEELKTAIRARRLIKHRINQLSGGLGPMTKDCFFNHELPMSEIVSHAQILKRRYIVNSVGVNPSFPTITM